jgi:HJR/Mrr/RecB family endonuclease
MKLTARQKQKFSRIRRLSQMKNLDPVEFEYFSAYLYQKQGYRVAATAISGDEGIDLIMRRWGRKIVVQCKRYSGTVGQPVVRDLYGSMVHEMARGAHLVTTGTISNLGAHGRPLSPPRPLWMWIMKLRYQPLPQRQK